MSDDPVRLVDAPDAPPYLVELVRGLEPPPLPPPIRTRTLERLERRTTPSPWRVGPALAIAAAVTLGVVTFSLVETEPQPLPEAASIVDESAPIEEPPHPEPPLPQEEDVPDEALAQNEPAEEVQAEPAREVAGGSWRRCDPRARDYSRCIIEALEGRTRTAREHAMLIEAYRSVGETLLAYSHMERFVERYPRHRTAHTYRRILNTTGFLEPGRLVIQTIPSARVFIDGRDTGRNTPVDGLAVPAGTRLLGLRTADGTMHEYEIEVRADETVRVVKRL